jgi:hypothetical protein
MVHVRFETPNLWALYLGQIADGFVDEALFPTGRLIAPMLRRFRCRRDREGAVSPPRAGYLASLPSVPYSGPEKVATVLVLSHGVGSAVIEVPDWTIYGAGLDRLTPQNRAELECAAVDLGLYFRFVAALPRNGAGEPAFPKPLRSADARPSRDAENSRVGVPA